MASLTIPDHGAMAAVMAPLDEIERIVASVDGYVVIANVNSTHQAVIGGATEAVERAIEAFGEAGHTATRIPVSHAFHTAIVAPVERAAPAERWPRWSCAPLCCRSWPTSTASSTRTGGPGLKDRMLDILAARSPRRSSSSRACGTLYEAGARVFVEVGPKRALAGFAEDVLGSEHDDVLALFTNHPKYGDMPSFNAALCGLYAAGLGYQAPPARLARARAADVRAGASRRSSHLTYPTGSSHAGRPLRRTRPPGRRSH